MAGKGAHGLIVQVKSGLHAGVTQDLPPGRYIVGSADDADLVLSDAALAPQHYVIETLGFTLRIEALADGVQVGESTLLSTGESCAVARAVEILAGDVHIVWTPPGETSGHPAVRRRVTNSLHLLFGVMVIFGAQTLFFAQPIADASIMRTLTIQHAVHAGIVTGSQAGTLASAASTPLVSTPPATTGSTAPAESAVAPAPKAATKPEVKKPEVKIDLVTVAAELNRRAQDAGLVDIKVAADASTITAAGTVDPKALSRWQDAQQWFDQRFEGQVTLVNRVTVQVETLPASLAIEAVWRGTHPHLVIRGQKYMEGAMVDGGWSIQRIEAERVVLVKADRLVALRF
jgi:Inner membrane component of T3SS, cytoplasmic domain/Inner membrane component of T3SS, periplasmic domain